MATAVQCCLPTEFASLLARYGPSLALAPAEQLLLQPAHPFLHYGRWRGFVAGDGTCGVRLVASVDSRQTSDGVPVGAIGFIVGDEPAALVAAFSAAHHWLAAEGAGCVRAPVRLSTWFGHRAVTAHLPEEGGEPPFALEPVNGRALLQALQSAGYGVASEAVSHRVEHARVLADGLPVLARWRRAGVRERAIDLDRLGEELNVLHGIAEASFAGGWGMAPITAAEFGGYFGALARGADPELVRLALDPAGQPLGFVFAYVASGGSLVVKTLGVLPAARRRYPGLGFGLVARVHEIGQGRGSPDGLHALMAVESVSQRTSIRWGREIRRYATFERRCGGAVE